MRVLILSGYELGHQPLVAAAAAGAVRQAGHYVRIADLAVDDADGLDDSWPEAVLVAVPMHTATRLGVAAARRLRGLRPDLPMAAFGLYAPAAARAAADLFGLAVAGEFEPALVQWLEDPHVSPPELGAVRVDLSRGVSGRPARDLLGGLERYARLQVDGEERLAGYLEASRGCVHRCRHCPVPVVYDGRIRTMAIEELVADADQLVEQGAQHLTFGDPDFLNGPRHSLRAIRAVHQRHPQLTFDCTVKVEHILAHPSVWPELAAMGLIFVVSAFESVSQPILDRLAKGHTPSDAAAATRLLRSEGIAVRPTFLPFTPWTRLVDIVDLFDFVIAQGLAPAVDPIQYAIRLLVPPGSLLLSDPDSAPFFGPYDPDALAHPWRAGDPTLDDLQRQLEDLAAVMADEPLSEAFLAMRAAVADAAAGAGLDPPAPAPPGPWPAVPRLSEAWFCCAEPSLQLQARAGGGVRREAPL